MTQALNEAPFLIAQEGEWLRGPWRAPCNIAADAEGSIHHDATAQALGLRGGTVAGSIHMEQCPPLCRAVLGPAWLEAGSLALSFRHATQGGEPVRVSLRPDGETRAEVVIHTQEGVVVAQGSASRGCDPHCPLQTKLAALSPPPSTLRIVRRVRLGATAEVDGVQIPASALEAYRSALTEPMPDGPNALPYNLTIDVLRAVDPALAPLPDGVVGLYGAIAVTHFNGPLRADTPYRVVGFVRGLAETPQTEAIWYESEAWDQAGRLKAQMLMQARVMKASSPLWAAP